MEISIIIPVYNVEDYITRCLDSVVQQLTEDVEVLIINDGSVDNSRSKCSMYTCDPRIVIYDKENGGLSDARNYGIERAKGEYLLFLDSDDSLTDKAIKQITDSIKENGFPDILLLNANRISEFGRRTFKHIPFSGTGTDYLKMFTGEGARVEAWLCCCKRKFIVDNNLFFEKGLLHEDLLWFTQIMLQAQKVSYAGITTYNYYFRDNSIMQKKDKSKNFRDIDYICHVLDSEIKKTGDRILVNRFGSVLAGVYINSILMLNKENTRQLKSFDRKFLIRKYNKNLMYIKAAICFLSPKLYWWIHQN